MTHPAVKIGFRKQVLEIPIECLVPLKEINAAVTGCRKFSQIKASLTHVGLIEPLAVFPQNAGFYLVLNGNLRLHLLKQLGVATVRCIVSLEDEGYTYNKRVNSLSPIAEHYMILKAIANGVTEERIATGLNIDVEAIRRRRNLLDGICPEVVELLRERRISHSTFGTLRKMKPLGQIEAAELMLSASNFSSPFAAIILGVTKPELLVKPPKAITKRDSPHASILLEETTDTLIAELAVARKTYGADVLDLTVICRCIGGLLANLAVDKYLRQNHADARGELGRLLEDTDGERREGDDNPRVHTLTPLA